MTGFKHEKFLFAVGERIFLYFSVFTASLRHVANQEFESSVVPVCLAGE